MSCRLIGCAARGQVRSGLLNIAVGRSHTPAVSMTRCVLACSDSQALVLLPPAAPLATAACLHTIEAVVCVDVRTVQGWLVLVGSTAMLRVVWLGCFGTAPGLVAVSSGCQQAVCCRS